MTFLLLYTLTSVLGFWYLGSSVVALVFGFFTSFILQKFWTFRNRSLERVRIQLPLHLLLSLSNIVLNTIFLFILVEYVGLWYLFAQFIITGLLACMNFFIYRGYIFHI